MTDFLLDENNDLVIKNGDILIGDSTLQNQNLIIQSQKGEFKNVPEIGVGILSEINNENKREVLSQIRRNFEYDGMTVNKLGFANNGNILVDAEYK